MIKRKKPVEGKVISKTEDKIWHEWYDKLTPEDHNKMLAKLGLDEEDRAEFKEELKADKPKPVSKARK
ncbi:hypothetical protein KKG83_07550 [Candidatus Micrarchaeota archaeon]|nr:hypothetical protein [Candidatus Micrarchaeota archaeon]MBU2477295.1 hypothetical protein [Candidatus Micrarchaeota archaeon]